MSLLLLFNQVQGDVVNATVDLSLATTFEASVSIAIQPQVVLDLTTSFDLQPQVVKNIALDFSLNTTFNAQVLAGNILSAPPRATLALRPKLIGRLVVR